MSIEGIETLVVEELPNLLLVQVHLDSGIVGLGETYYGAAAAEAHLHEALAPALVGRAMPRDADELRALLTELEGYVGYLGSGAEVRALSAVDLALWDAMGQEAGLPLTELLGGRVRSDVQIYNTCAGPHYMRNPSGQKSANWGVAGEGRHEDLYGFLHHADRLAEDLLSEGVSAMKIWPFDVYAERSAGREISRADLDAGLGPLRKVRDAVGDRMRLLVELHGLWEPSAARVILAALAEFDPLWVEDPIRPDRYAELGELRAASPVPIAAGETLGGRTAVAPLLDRRGVDVLIADLGWCGGISEVLALAERTLAAEVPLALHDCSGPVVLAASAHLAVHLPHVFIQETTRAYYSSWYPQLVTGLPDISAGRLSPGTAPGHGVRLRPDLDQSATVRRRVTGATHPLPLARS
ncbi:mandelate racemase/muconate lactonizing enzyme family protein [Nonomuraea sp. NPDC049480]|uniref:mandelate racemase/muconate lactonizing enzyme family protein n=1 Tax=Nonomuraea sp. NPDC049480 TaxID=3364353 RepID=UPI0037A5FAF8